MLNSNSKKEDDALTVTSLTSEYTLLDPLIATEPEPPKQEENHSSSSLENSGRNSSGNANNDDDDSVQSELEFPKATRGQVNGAAVVFGSIGFIIGGPFVGLITAAGSAHAAANKDGNFANLSREWGGKLNNFGKSKHKETRRESSTTANATRDTTRVPKEKRLWDKVTDELLNGAAWVERRL